MMTTTFFGEITELGSRALWYSDDEDDGDSLEDDIEMQTSPQQTRLPLDLANHESLRSDVSLTFRRQQSIDPSIEIVNCIISLSSTVQYKHTKFDNPLSKLVLYGYIENCGRVYIYPHMDINGQQNGYSMYIVFDAGYDSINGYKVSYFVEALRDLIYSDLNVSHNSPVIILSQQFSQSEHLEFLSNHASCSSMVRPPFNTDHAIIPPVLIKNQFESALFEQLTLTMKLAYVVCLPDPKDYWFDQVKIWPSISNEIVDLKLNDDHLDKTLIFT